MSTVTAEAPKLEKPLRRFRVVAGVHSEGYETDSDGQKHPKIYQTGEIVETRTDLVALHNSPGSIKFAEVSESGDDVATEVARLREDLNEAVRLLEANGITAPAASQPTEPATPDKSGLEAMTRTELERFAAENEIDVSTCSRKDEVLNTIVAALNL